MSFINREDIPTRYRIGTGGLQAKVESFYKSYGISRQDICPQCQQEYIRYTGEIEYEVKLHDGTHTLCSYNCKRKFMREHEEELEQIKQEEYDSKFARRRFICENCKSPSVVYFDEKECCTYNSEGKAIRFCCADCRQEYKEKHNYKLITCPVCGIQKKGFNLNVDYFIGNVYGQRKKVFLCSRECADVNKEKNKEQTNAKKQEK